MLWSKPIISGILSFVSATPPIDDGVKAVIYILLVLRIFVPRLNSLNAQHARERMQSTYSELKEKEKRKRVQLAEDGELLEVED